MLSAIAFALALAPGSAATAVPDVHWIDCPENLPSLINLGERGPGPLRLAKVICRPTFSSPYPTSPNALSPDGARFAVYGALKGLYVYDIPSPAEPEIYAADIAGSATVELVRSERSVFAWRDASTLWTVKQPRAEHGGWATGPVEPMKAAARALTPLPPLRHPAGPLDSLYWIGGQGHALAQFGSRGRYYKPEHTDPDPTFAFVDASRGQVLDTLRFSLIDPAAMGSFLVRDITAGALPDGHLRAVIRMNRWVVWTQGGAPSLLDQPYPIGEHLNLIMSPDASTLLVERALPTGGVCVRRTGCHPGELMRGPIAILHELPSGRVLWRLEAESNTTFPPPPQPVFSPDGRYILIGLPTYENGDIAVVSARDGKILQRIATFRGHGYWIGFTEDGRAWVSGAGTTAFYDIP